MSKVNKSVSREGKENQINMKENVMYVLLTTYTHKITHSLTHSLIIIYVFWRILTQTLSTWERARSRQTALTLNFVLFVALSILTHYHRSKYTHEAYISLSLSSLSMDWRILTQNGVKLRARENERDISTNLLALVLFVAVSSLTHSHTKKLHS